MSDTTANPQDFVTKRKQPLLGTLSISLLIHAAVIALLGGVVVFKVLEATSCSIQTAAAAGQGNQNRAEKLQHKIKIREQQQIAADRAFPRVSPPTASRASHSRKSKSIRWRTVKTNIEKCRQEPFPGGSREWTGAGPARAAWPNRQP